MDRKFVFIQGSILIVITMLVNIIMVNWIISERISEIKLSQISIVRSVDHIFTALTYMERNDTNKFNKNIKLELEAAREDLRAPQLLIIRRKVAPHYIKAQ